MASTTLLVAAVLGASEDVTVTELDAIPVKPPNVDVLWSDEWPHAVTVSVNPERFSPTVAVNVQVAISPGAIPVSPPGGVEQPDAVPSYPVAPVGQVGPVKPDRL